MAKYWSSVEVGLPAPEVFAYLADFSNARLWDPNVVEAAQVGTDTPTRGSRFQITALFYGRRIPFEYVITEYDPHQRLVLTADDKKIEARAQFTLKSHLDGTTVVYEPAVSLRGSMKLLNKGLQVAFDAIGAKAADGLRKALAGLPPAASYGGADPGQQFPADAMGIIFPQR